MRFKARFGHVAMHYSIIHSLIKTYELNRLEKKETMQFPWCTQAWSSVRCFRSERLTILVFPVQAADSVPCNPKRRNSGACMLCNHILSNPRTGLRCQIYSVIASNGLCNMQKRKKTRKGDMSSGPKANDKLVADWLAQLLNSLSNLDLGLPTR